MLNSVMYLADEWSIHKIYFYYWYDIFYSYFSVWSSNISSDFPTGIYVKN